MFLSDLNLPEALSASGISLKWRNVIAFMTGGNSRASVVLQALEKSLVSDDATQCISVSVSHMPAVMALTIRIIFPAFSLDTGFGHPGS